MGCYYLISTSRQQLTPQRSNVRFLRPIWVPESLFCIAGSGAVFTPGHFWCRLQINIFNLNNPNTQKDDSLPLLTGKKKKKTRKSFFLFLLTCCETRELELGGSTRLQQCNELDCCWYGSSRKVPDGENEMEHVPRCPFQPQHLWRCTASSSEPVAVTMPSNVLAWSTLYRRTDIYRCTHLSEGRAVLHYS